MSETMLTQDAIQAIRNREPVTVYMTRDLGSEAKTVVITPEERRALCDAAARAETLEAQLTEVTRERDDAKLALSVVQNAAKTLVRGADRRVLDATKHEPAARVAIATLDSEREMNAILTQQLEAAEAALAPLRAVVGEASIVACDACGRELGSAPTIPPCPECIGFKRAKAHALPADPSAPMPLVSVTRAQAEQRLTDVLVNRIYRAIEHMNGWEDEDSGYDGAKKAIIAALFPDSAAASGQAR